MAGKTETAVITMPHGRAMICNDEGECAGVFRIAFDSYDEAFRAAALGDLTGYADECQKVCEGNGSYDKRKWIGLTKVWPRRTWQSFEGLAGLVNENWQEGLDILEGFEQDLVDAGLREPSSRLRQPKWDDCYGDEVCWDRMRSGQDFWRTSQRSFKASAAEVTILLDMGQNWNHDWKDSIWRCAAGTACAIALEKSGYAVEIHAVHRSNGLFTGGKERLNNFFNSIKLKSFGQPLDRSLVVNVCSGWFLRTVGFRLLSVATMQNKRRFGGIVSSLGSHRTPTTHDCLFVTPDENCFVFANVWNKSDALASAKAAIKSVDPEMFYEADQEAMSI